MKAKIAQLRDLVRSRDVSAVPGLAQDILAAFPQDAQLSVLCGRGLEAAGRYVDAVAAYKRALRLEPDHETALHGILSICLRLRKYLFARWLLRGRLRSSTALQVEMARARLALIDRDHQGAETSIAAAEAAGGPPQQIEYLRSKAAALRTSRVARPAFDYRHIAIGGVSFCGSTVLSSLLGSVDGVFNIGESHHLISQIEPLQIGQDPRQMLSGGLFDWSTGDVSQLYPCHTCGPQCRVFDNDFRAGLARDRTGWYERIAEKAQAKLLVSSDKNYKYLSEMVPDGNLDLIVLYKNPTAAWRSELKNKRRLLNMNIERPALSRDAAGYLTLWANNYLDLLLSLRPTGTMVVMNWEGFCRAPEAHMERLLSLLKLSSRPSPLGHVKPEQHFFGGNLDVRSDLKAAGSIAASASAEIPASDAREIAGHALSRYVHGLLETRYRGCFGDLSPAIPGSA